MRTPVIVSPISLKEAANKVSEFGLFSKVPSALFGENNTEMRNAPKVSDQKVSLVVLCYETVRKVC